MLRDTQFAFAASLLAGDARVNAEIRAGKLSAARRLEIYRHNVYANLRGVLKDIYPVVLSVVGEAFFVYAADQFVRVQPSRSGDLNQFGAELPAFLAVYPHAAALPYLPDVAQLEWVWHEAFHAADAGRFDLARLAAIPTEQHATLCFALHPAIRLIHSDFPILRIWEVNQPEFTGGMEVDWDVPAESLLIHRANGVEVLIERVPEPSYAFLQALSRHANLETAASAALAIDPAFDLQGFLLEFVQSGIITDFNRE